MRLSRIVRTACTRADGSGKNTEPRVTRVVTPVVIQ